MMDTEMECEPKFVIDKNPSNEISDNIKHQSHSSKRKHWQDSPKDYHSFKKRNLWQEKSNYKKNFHFKDDKKNFASVKKENHHGIKNEKCESSESNIKASVVYYENVLKDLRKGFDIEIKDVAITNTLEESEGKEVELACHSLVSHCLEILLANCNDISVLMRFMSAFEKDKVTVCTSANASHLTELLMYHAIKALQNGSPDANSEDNKEECFLTFCTNWLLEFGKFVSENMADCLSSPYSCHVVCTLIGALAGDLAENKERMSKNLKNHKQEFHSQFNEINSTLNQQNNSLFVLEQIPKSFKSMLKTLYKTFLEIENISDFVSDSSSATVIEALIFALKKRLPKACKKMINKLVKKLFQQENNDGVPLCLLSQNASYVFDEVFKAADETLQLTLWTDHISFHLKKLVMHPIGNFIVQRIFDAINDRTLFETACTDIWYVFDQVIESHNYGIFVSVANACNRIGAQQSFFMENIMKCLQCFEPLERQDLLVPLLLRFIKYDDYINQDTNSDEMKVCLQGSLVVQAILKFQKPFKAVKSIQSMAPHKLDFLSGHIQGCHVLNAYFGSNPVGDKNKEKLLQHMRPVLLSMACHREKSLTLSRIWTSISLKSKEVIAREFFSLQEILRSTKSGYAVFQKFGIPHFRRLEEWKQMQANIKKPIKH